MRYHLNEPGLCECGCGQATRPAPCSRASKGWVKGQPLRFVRGHSNRKSGVDYIENENGCWIWQRATTKGGYGVTDRGDGRQTTAHRVYYERFVGPIPAGLQLDHLCRVRLCVNPAHLEPVTSAENNQRGSTAILNWEKVKEIRTSSLPRAQLVQMYGVSPRTISSVRAGTTWRGPG